MLLNKEEKICIIIYLIGEIRKNNKLKKNKKYFQFKLKIKKFC